MNSVLKLSKLYGIRIIYQQIFFFFLSMVSGQAPLSYLGIWRNEDSHFLSRCTKESCYESQQSVFQQVLQVTLMYKSIRNTEIN